MKNQTELTWNGSADLANKVFGESYGSDWEYVSNQSLDIIVHGRLIKVGETIEKA